ncbi:MAG: RdgB/HAM1 family non-canonical purine NTP pyrophosphatase [Gordonibacter sp.]|uniref:RdgB/HAM1 family non-canonical purine NTP pyrophosphatase n=1 Tax=Gordonibacter sp. TaxID=1968902 RepID=UPI002FC90A5A
MKTVVLATNNAHKVSEIATALDFPGWEFRTLRELGIESDPAEDADSFEGNARIKARVAHEASGGLAALADDSGLVVDALDGAPGVHSARYAGEPCDDAANNAKLLAVLADVPDEARTARFASTLVFVDEDGSERVATGTIEGCIGHEERGSEGFGYDPLFLPDVFGGGRTLAEVSQADKNAVSHRGNALRALRAALEGDEGDRARAGAGVGDSDDI